MSNISNYYFNNIDSFLTGVDYWDLFLSYDQRNFDWSVIIDDSIVTKCLLSYIDINNPSSISGNTLYSLVSWDKAVSSTGTTICDIGLTGVDNGLVSNLTGETLIISGDTRLCLNKVTGSTYDYNVFFTGDSFTNYIQFCGGFYQGFFKLHDYDYEVLPIRYERGFTAEMWVNKNDLCPPGSTGNTLNDTYPNNKGFFLFLGTRSENKFWNIFSGETGLTTCSGVTLSPHDIIDKSKDINPFLKFNKKNAVGCPGASSGVTFKEKNPNKDIIDNLIGFRIKDDGSIGYRTISFSGECTGVTTASTFVITPIIKESYSDPGVTPDNTWIHLVVKFQYYSKLTDCDLIDEDKRLGKLIFYINGYPAFTIEDVDEVIFRELSDYKEKQVGVPFSITLGGGSQGLSESITFGGPDPSDFNLLVEQNFAGSFIGGISKFRLYGCPMDITYMRKNYRIER